MFLLLPRDTHINALKPNGNRTMSDEWALSLIEPFESLVVAPSPPPPPQQVALFALSWLIWLVISRSLLDRQENDRGASSREFARSSFVAFVGAMQLSLTIAAVKVLSSVQIWFFRSFRLLACEVSWALSKQWNSNLLEAYLFFRATYSLSQFVLLVSGNNRTLS